MCVFFKQNKGESLENFNSQTMHAGKSTSMLIIFLQNCNLMSLVSTQQYINSTHNFKSKDLGSVMESSEIV